MTHDSVSLPKLYILHTYIRTADPKLNDLPGLLSLGEFSKMFGIPANIVSVVLVLLNAK